MLRSTFFFQSLSLFSGLLATTERRTVYHEPQPLASSFFVLILEVAAVIATVVLIGAKACTCQRIGVVAVVKVRSSVRVYHRMAEIASGIVTGAVTVAVEKTTIAAHRTLLFIVGHSRTLIAHIAHILAHAASAVSVTVNHADSIAEVGSGVNIFFS